MTRYACHENTFKCGEKSQLILKLYFSQLVEEMSANTKSVVVLDQEENKADEELFRVKEELNSLKEEVIKKPHIKSSRDI